MKGGLVILAFALEAIVRAEPQLLDEISLRIVLNPDEEQFSPASRDIITAEAKRAHAACILEPAREGAYIIGRKACGWFRLTAKGIASHAGEEPEKGANAIESLAHKLVQLRQLNDPQTGTTISAGEIRGGTAPNVVPDFAEAVIDVRVLQPSAAVAFHADLERVLVRQEIDGTRVSGEGHFVFPPWQPDGRSRRLFALVREIGQGLGLTLAPAVSGAGSDGNYIARHIPTIDGTGAVGGGAHSPGEYIERASLVQRARVLANFIRKWARRKGAGEA
jgi:glutamate carboxypeptidase